jgi:hypothetical protein
LSWRVRSVDVRVEEPLQRLDAVRRLLLRVFAVLLSDDLRPLVAVGLTRLGEQDQRRRVRGLGREREVQQDERARIPVGDDRDRVERDPEDDDDGLADDVLRCAEEPRRLLRAAPEGVAAERAVVLVAARHTMSVRIKADS